MSAVTLPPDWQRRAIIVSGDPIESWFTPAELAEAGRFSRSKRREEWMLSRFAAKKLALEQAMETDPRRCLVTDRRIGSRYVSLSHSRPYAAAAIDDAPVGIDIELVRPLNERAAHFFLSGEETEVMQACAIRHRLLHFWCAKEAVWKQRGGEVETLRGVPLHLERESDRGLRFESVETVQINDLIIALTGTPRPIS